MADGIAALPWLDRFGIKIGPYQGPGSGDEPWVDIPGLRIGPFTGTEEKRQRVEKKRDDKKASAEKAAKDANVQFTVVPAGTMATPLVAAPAGGITSVPLGPVQQTVPGRIRYPEQAPEFPPAPSQGGGFMDTVKQIGSDLMAPVGGTGSNRSGVLGGVESPQNFEMAYPAYPGGQPFLGQVAGADTTPYELQNNKPYTGMSVQEMLESLPNISGGGGASIPGGGRDGRDIPMGKPAEAGPTVTPSATPGVAPEAPLAPNGAPVATDGTPYFTPEVTQAADQGADLQAYIQAVNQAYGGFDAVPANPRQDAADAYAARAAERNALLAQLAFAANVTSAAGPGWKGIGGGFADAAVVHDKGFQRYQDALQDSANRYGDRAAKQQDFDMAKRDAAVKMWQSDQTTKRSEAKEARKQAIESITKMYDSEQSLRFPKGTGDDILGESGYDPAQVEEYLNRRNRGLQDGRYYYYVNKNVADK